jgi:hypothetical protein
LDELTASGYKVWQLPFKVMPCLFWRWMVPGKGSPQITIVSLSFTSTCAHTHTHFHSIYSLTHFTFLPQTLSFSLTHTCTHIISITTLMHFLSIYYSFTQLTNSYTHSPALCKAALKAKGAELLTLKMLTIQLKAEAFKHSCLQLNWHIFAWNKTKYKLKIKLHVLTSYLPDWVL